jgi:hypothetical protein
MSRRHVILFQPRFAPLVEAGAKLQTIRPLRKRPVQSGDVLDLRTWTGAPYRSPQRKLREVVCTRTAQIEIDSLRGLVWIGEGFESELLTRRQADRFAQRDGFKGRGEMADWFEAMHGLPFAGVLIEWAP